MNLYKVLDRTNTRDKMKFIKCLEEVCVLAEKNDVDIQRQFAKLDNENMREASRKSIVERFNIVSNYYKEFIKDNISVSGGQLKLLTSLLARDGNCYAKKSWIEQIYKNDFNDLNKLSKKIKKSLENIDEDEGYTQNYRLYIYKECYKEAYENDERINREKKVTEDEKLVLNKLAELLNLTGKETSAIENIVKPVKKGNIDSALKKLKDFGILFFVEKGNSILVADEIIALLNEIDNKTLSDKLVRRVLRSLQDVELSNVLKRHDQKIRGVSRDEKIKYIFKSDFGIKNLLKKLIHSPGSTQNARKARLKDIISYLELTPPVLGKTLDERVDILIEELKNNTENDARSLTDSGYVELLESLSGTKPSVNSRIREEFEISDMQEIEPEYLNILGITPLDVLYLYSNEEIKNLKDQIDFSVRGNHRLNIIEKFGNINDKLLENYHFLSKRDFKALTNLSIQISESEIGIKFEECTKILFKNLGLVVDDELRSKLSSKKDKPDIVLNIGGDDVIICECKTIKNGDYTKYSSVSKQLKSYALSCENQGKRVAQVLIIAPGFSEDFINHSQTETEINISLLEAKGLMDLVDAYSAKRKPRFSANLLTKGGLLNTSLFIKNM